MRNCLFHPEKIALFIEEPALQISVKSATPLADVGGWVGALHEKEFDNYYKQNKSIIENGKPNILSQKKLIPTVYAYSNSPITDSDMENEIIINKNKEVTQTENYKRKNSNKDIVDNDLVLGEDERHLLNLQYSSLHKERRSLFCFECVNSPLLIMSTIKCLEGL